MTDTASISSDHYASSSSSSYAPSLQHSSASGRFSSVSQHRPPGLKINTTLPRRPHSQPVMAASDPGENDGNIAATKPLLLPISGSSSYTYQHDEFNELRNKKRGKSIDTDEANQPSLSKLSLYTPTTARSDGPRDLICLCAKAPKVPRPRNAFILYRQAWQGHFAAQHPGLANPEISKLIGEKWREQPESVKNEWKQLAEKEKVRHQLQYPGYRYQPRRGGKNSSGRPTSSSGDAPGRCPKCGGRYIATPRTPTTPFRIASPPSSKRPTNMQSYTNADHQRHGSISGGSMQVDPHARRYTQPQLRDTEEDYTAMSPIAAPHPGMLPDTKRRRYNGPPVYVPASPHMGYAPVDPRYAQHPAIGGPPVSATGYGPGHIPRPSLQHRSGHYTGHTASTHMQPPPPPRPSMSYQAVSTPNRPNSGFDESLRLPPLQTQVNESPAASTELQTRQTMVPVQLQQTSNTGLAIANPGSGSVRQQQQPHASSSSASSIPQKWPFLLKLDLLRSISPPLRPPGLGGPHFETRGPIIAVEGAPTQMLKDVAAVIEKALSVSAEFAVRVWSEDTSTTIAHSSPEPHSSSSGSSEANNNNNNNNNDKEGVEHGGNAAALQKKSLSLISPIANYVARMLKWHKTSEDLIRYITSFPINHRTSGSTDGNGTSSAVSTSNNTSSPSHRLPVAILSDGYSLTFSDRYASALHVNDAYRADDHWQWVATMWRGVVGADLTVYVKRPADDVPGGGNGAGGVEIACPGVMILRVPDAGRVDEKLERRLGFEIAEWVRGGSFTAGFGKM